MPHQGAPTYWFRRFPALLISVILPVAVVLGVACSSLPRAATLELTNLQPRVRAVLLNGGGHPSSNYYSHFLHIKRMLDVLCRAGVAPADITIFNADGADPKADFAVREPQPEVDFWLVEGTRLAQPLRPQLRFENSVIDGFSLQPATRAALRQWFTEAAKRLRPGDTLLFYVTDHGTKNSDDLTNNRIVLWGEQETLSVNELRQMFARLSPRVRVVVLMSQCFSGSFANLIYPGVEQSLSTGNMCGFFSSTPDRQAYGCYPENRDKDNIGHSFAFIENLAAGDTFSEAHDHVLVADLTPDVPRKTSDVYLEQLLEKEARKRGQSPDALIEELLVFAWRDAGAWEPEIRLLDRIGQASGSFSPRSLQELQEQTKILPELGEQFLTYSKAWDSALQALVFENLERFTTQQSNWRERLDEKSLNALAAQERQFLTHTLLNELGEFTRANTTANERLRVLREKAESAANAHYRMQVRLGMALRMRDILTRIAGQVYLEQTRTAQQRKAYEHLSACEALSLGELKGEQESPAPPAPFPSYDEDRRLIETVLPSWLGINFKQASQATREQFSLQKGASTVLAVYPNSPAQQAGLEAGDIVLGPPNAPFTEPQQIREWAMTAPVGKAAPIAVRRGEQSLGLTLTPQRYPIKWPTLPGPPQVGSEMPRLRDLKPYRGALPVALSQGGGTYLLFFWATWCGPCKASLPEVVAFEQESGVPVIAITDEPVAQLDAFFTQYHEAFPAIVAVDEFRKAFLAYGVHGTPTFVLADGAGKVQSFSSGYRAETGLPFAGWSWTKR
jgi:thiol-disulfide isomerase/thioredoxin